MTKELREGLSIDLFPTSKYCLGILSFLFFFFKFIFKLSLLASPSLAWQTTVPNASALLGAGLGGIQYFQGMPTCDRHMGILAAPVCLRGAHRVSFVLRVFLGPASLVNTSRGAQLQPVFTKQGPPCAVFGCCDLGCCLKYWKEFREWR